MFFHSSYDSMKDLCDGLKGEGYIQSKRVYDALMNVDRADFTPIGPYEDRPQPINYNVTYQHPICMHIV